MLCVHFVRFELRSRHFGSWGCFLARLRPRFPPLTTLGRSDADGSSHASPLTGAVAIYDFNKSIESELFEC